MAKRKFKEWDEYNTTVMGYFACWIPAIVVVVVFAFLLFGLFSELNAIIDNAISVT